MHNFAGIVICLLWIWLHALVRCSECVVLLAVAIKYGRKGDFRTPAD